MAVHPRRRCLHSLLLIAITVLLYVSPVYGDDNAAATAAARESAQDTSSAGDASSSSSTDDVPKEKPKPSYTHTDDWGSFYDPNKVSKLVRSMFDTILWTTDRISTATDCH
jgi:hypothetical protein